MCDWLLLRLLLQQALIRKEGKVDSSPSSCSDSCRNAWMCVTHYAAEGVCVEGRKRATRLLRSVHSRHHVECFPGECPSCALRGLYSPADVMESCFHAYTPLLSSLPPPLPSFSFTTSAVRIAASRSQNRFFLFPPPLSRPHISHSRVRTGASTLSRRHRVCLSPLPLAPITHVQQV
jgi:hypothetical protein